MSKIVESRDCNGCYSRCLVEDGYYPRKRRGERVVGII